MESRVERRSHSPGRRGSRVCPGGGTPAPWRKLLLCLPGFLLLLPTPGAAQERSWDPVADTAATVVSGQARFTVLTPSLLRLEWSADGEFEDRASVVFVNRRLPVPEYRTRRRDGWLVLETDRLTLRYRPGSGRFTSENLRIDFRVAGRRRSWRPGEQDTANLGGTIRTLDGVKGPVSMDSGLLSRAGWALVDDTRRPLFDSGEWPWAVARPEGERQDWYFFGHGHRYEAALKDFTRVAGRIPMPPRFAFGRFWSRYWAYTDREYQDLVRQFDAFGVPLDVLVVDMDWHRTFELRWRRQPKDQAGQLLGWTGYTWNETYFPSPETFLEWAEEQGLKTPLNLHPASGIQPHEKQYEAMARAMGMDPEKEEYVPFRITDEKFARAYFEHVIHPLEEQGVDFWWLDWQQWHETEIPGLTPTWWLNYVFFSDMRRQDGARPILMHRYGGLGNHRYQIGFSGDARSTWKMLAFEPEFTATASNVLFGYWSHDIGGHAPGDVTPELYTRWVQFGAFSPILRTHTTKNPDARRRSWTYPYEYFRVMRATHRLRYRLIPYIYTAARQAFETGVSLVRPMYYSHPERPEAYRFSGQYMFGDDLLVSPVAEPVSGSSLVTRKKIWLPEGRWVEWYTGDRLEGPAVVERTFALDEIPVYARAGAVIPMQPVTLRADARPPDPLILTIFPGDSGSTRVYGDAGNSLAYRRGEYAWTPVRHTTDDRGRSRIVVGPAEGSYDGMPGERGLRVRLSGRSPPERVTAGGREVPYAPDGQVPGWRYDGDRQATVISLSSADVRTRRVVEVVPSDTTAGRLTEGVRGSLSRIDRAVDQLKELWPQDWAPESLIALEQTGRRMTLSPDSVHVELRRLRRQLPAAVEEVRELRGERRHVRRAMAHLGTLEQLLDVELPDGEGGEPGTGRGGTPRRSPGRR